MAYKETDELIHVGILGPGKPFFTAMRGESSAYTLGLRIGRGDLSWTPGLWQPELEKFVAPAAGTASRGVVDISALEAAYPGVGYALPASE